LNEWRLVNAKLDAEQSSMSWSGAEIVSVELVDGVDLGKSSDRRMECGRD
jgi:hypothetical protein